MNTSGNHTQPEPEPEPELTVANSLVYSVPVSVVIGIILSIFTLMTIVFNLGGALIFLLDKELHTFSDRLITNLVIADGSVGLLVMPVKVILALTSDVWVWSRPLCLTFITVEATTNLVSVLNTFIVTIDHYWLVRKRQNYTTKQTRRLLLFMCITPWVSVFVFFGSPHFLTEFVLTRKSPVPPGTCAPPFQDDLGIFLILLLSPFVPIIAVPVYDTLIYFTLRRQLVTKVRTLISSGSVDLKRLSALGITTEDDTKSLVSLTLLAHPDVSQESESSYLEESGSLVDPDHSQVDHEASLADAEESQVDPEVSVLDTEASQLGGDSTVEIYSIAKPVATKQKSAPLLRILSRKNANNNADEPAAVVSPTDVTAEVASPPEGEAAEKKEDDVEVLGEFASDVKEARLSLTLGTVLVITCTPFESLNLIGAICDIVKGCIFKFPPRLLQGCRWWVLLSSTVNPVLIFSLDHRYKAGFFRFLKRLRGQSIDDVSSGAKPPVLSS